MNVDFDEIFFFLMKVVLMNLYFILSTAASVAPLWVFTSRVPHLCLSNVDLDGNMPLQFNVDVAHSFWCGNNECYPRMQTVALLHSSPLAQLKSGIRTSPCSPPSPVHSSGSNPLGLPTIRRMLAVEHANEWEHCRTIQYRQGFQHGLARDQIENADTVN